MAAGQPPPKAGYSAGHPTPPPLPLPPGFEIKPLPHRIYPHRKRVSKAVASLRSKSCPLKKKADQPPPKAGYSAGHPPPPKAGYSAGHPPPPPLPLPPEPAPQKIYPHRTRVPMAVAEVLSEPCPSMLRDESGPTICPGCDAKVMTKLEYENGTLTWIIVFVLYCLWLWPFCVIPLICDGCKDVVHVCPNCGKVISRYQRSM